MVRRLGGLGGSASGSEQLARPVRVCKGLRKLTLSAPCLPAHHFYDRPLTRAGRCKSGLSSGVGTDSTHGGLSEQQCGDACHTCRPTTLPEPGRAL
eukprot:358976-Chlamydomonas_euryale.AAC.6